MGFDPKAHKFCRNIYFFPNLELFLVILEWGRRGRSAHFYLHWVVVVGQSNTHVKHISRLDFTLDFHNNILLQKVFNKVAWV